jgi:phosphoenolpyruvate synthase/pyruvate phosphate dikinase
VASKALYASVFYRDSKAYMTATSNVIDQEKMAVILQEVVGKQYGNRFYPNFSGVLRSLNYYPIGEETAEEGIASLALGLGKYIVDGGQTLRVSPYHPHQVLQTSELDTALRETQTQFYALDMQHIGEDFKVDDGFNILKLKVKDADEDHSLNYIASTYDPYDQMIRDGIYEGGRKIISFSGVLQQGVFPLPEILQMSMEYGASEMKRPVEIEFACNLNDDRSGEFYLLQIRPIVDSKQMLEEDVSAIPDDRCLLRSHNSLGHGISEDVVDVIYVKTDENFSAMNNPAIAMDMKPSTANSLEWQKLCTCRARTLGFERPLARYSCQMATYQRCKGYRRGGSEELSRRPKSRHSLFPEPHELRCWLFHYRCQQAERTLPQGFARLDASSGGNKIPSPCSL